MTTPDTPHWGSRSLERARRWLERIRPLREAASDKVPDEILATVEDFVAAALGEVTEVLYKGQDQLKAAYEAKGKSNAKNLAIAFVKEWLKARPFIRAVRAVRHLDVHVEGQPAARTLQIQPRGSPSRLKVWWTLPPLQKEPHDQRLDPGGRLTEEERAAFNERVTHEDVCDTLAAAIREMELFEEAVLRELR